MVIFERKSFVFEVRDILLEQIPLTGYSPYLGMQSKTRATLPWSLFSNLGSTRIRISSTVFFKNTFFSSKDSTLSIYSDIVSLSIINRTVSNLKEPIVLTFYKAGQEAVRIQNILPVCTSHVHLYHLHYVRKLFYVCRLKHCSQLLVVFGKVSTTANLQIIFIVELSINVLVM